MELRVENLSERSFQFNWEDLLQSNRMKINLPKLSLETNEVWGDWGPMYEIDLQGAVTIHYNEVRTKLDLKKLKVETPISIVEREKYTHILNIEDKEKNLLFYLYLDKNYELTKVKVSRTVSSPLLNKGEVPVLFKYNESFAS